MRKLFGCGIIAFLVLAAAGAMLYFLVISDRNSNDIVYENRSGQTLHSSADIWKLRAKLKYLAARETIHGWFHGQANPIRERIDRYDIMLHRDPRSIPALQGRGAALTQVGEIPQALEDFKQAYALNPNDSLTLYELALAKIKSGEWRDGLRWMKMAQDKGFQETGNFMDSIRAPAKADSALGRLMMRSLGEKLD